MGAGVKGGGRAGELSPAYRLLHHATVITIAGDSYRMRSHRDALKTARATLSGG